MTGALDVDVSHDLGAFRLEARFVSPGPVTALFGPSGSGKTSLVNVIAGLIRPDHGRIRLGDAVLADSDSGRSLPVHKRRCGYVFQDARLFPHLNVRRNLMYGGWMLGRAPDGPAFEQIVDLLGLGPLLQRWPTSLSGGEKQRVAIGRALLAGPRLLLMDEPLASLDDERKDEILTYIERIRSAAQAPIVYVSHSVPEVVRLASHLAVLDKGKLTAFGPLAEMLARIGVGGGFGEPSALLDAVVADIDPVFGLTHLETSLGRVEVARRGLVAGQRLRIRILASDVILAARLPEAISAQNIMAAEVRDIQDVPDGAGMQVDVRLGVGDATLIARITARAARQLDLATGKPVFAVVKSVAIE